jgi:hypothetical protein
MKFIFDSKFLPSYISPFKECQTQNIFNLLVQSIKTENFGLQWHCLNSCNKHDVLNMCQKLSLNEVTRLLCAIVEKLRCKNSGWKKLFLWLESILIYHSKYLVADSQALSNIVTISRIIEARTSTYRPLLSLFGRLELITVNNTHKFDQY